MLEATKQLLEKPLRPDAISEREQSGRKFKYIEGHFAIREANRIFGFDGWYQRIDELKLVQQETKTSTTSGNENHWIGYTCVVTIMVGDVSRQDVGFGQGIDKDLGQAHESAIKEAVTDAMKRAMRTFGDPFGLALYDKKMSHVGTDALTAENMDEVATRFVLSIYQTEEDREQFEAICREKGHGWQRIALNARGQLVSTMEDLIKFARLHPRKGQARGAALAQEMQDKVKS